MHCIKLIREVNKIKVTFYSTLFNLIQGFRANLTMGRYQELFNIGKCSSIAYAYKGKGIIRTFVMRLKYTSQNGYDMDITIRKHI